MTLSPDGRLLTIGGQRVVLRGPKQRAVIRQLVEAHQRGSRVACDVLLAGLASNTLDKAFHGSPHWPILREFIRQQEREVWLEPK